MASRTAAPPAARCAEVAVAGRLWRWGWTGLRTCLGAVLSVPEVAAGTDSAVAEVFVCAAPAAADAPEIVPAVAVSTSRNPARTLNVRLVAVPDDKGRFFFNAL